MTGMEIIRAPGTTAEQIADIIAEHCPPVTPEHCDKLSCRECWLAWLTTGEPRRKRGRPTNRRPRTRKGCTPTSSRCTPRHTGRLKLYFTHTRLVPRALFGALLLSNTISCSQLRLEMPTQESGKFLLVENPLLNQVINQGPILGLHPESGYVQLIDTGIPGRHFMSVLIQEIPH